MAGNGRLHPLTSFTAIVFIVLGAVLAAGGAYLITLQGSWYSRSRAVPSSSPGLLLLIRRRSALILFALMLFGAARSGRSYEVKFDFWQLMPRLWIWLLIPFVHRGALFGPPATARGARMPLAAAVIIVLALGAGNPHDLAGRIDVDVAANPNQADTNAGNGRAPGDWTDWRFAAHADHAGECASTESGVDLPDRRQARPRRSDRNHRRKHFAEGRRHNLSMHAA